MKFLIDENMPKSLVRSLSSLGHDALDLRDIGKQGITDDELMKLALQENRIIITLNIRHLGNITLFPPATTPGVIIAKIPGESISKVCERIIKFLKITEETKIIKSLTILEKNKIRRRK